MQKSKIKLTNHQLDFADSTEYPLIKRAVIAQVVLLFDELGQSLSQRFGAEFPGGHPAWKITRGENYLDMPYVVADFPKIAQPDFPLLMRTFFWWGHYISFNLIIKPELVSIPHQLDIPGSFILNGDNIWQNDLESAEYMEVKAIEAAAVRSAAARTGYIRLGSLIPVRDYEQLNEKAEIYFGWLKTLGYGQKKEPLSGS